MKINFVAAFNGSFPSTVQIMGLILGLLNGTDKWAPLIRAEPAANRTDPLERFHFQKNKYPNSLPGFGSTIMLHGGVSPHPLNCQAVSLTSLG